MAHITIHIGLNKTGTSSLQDFLALNSTALRERLGLVYPQTGRDGAAHHALSRWAKAAAGEGKPPVPDLGQALLGELQGAERAVISSEDFHTHGGKSVALLARLLSGHDVRIVLYVREHVAYLASWYQQNVQASHQSSAFDTFCFLTRKPLHKIAELWAEHFGRERVTVRLYDRAALKGGDIVADFAELACLPADLSAFARKPYESNPSIAGNLLFAKRLMNNFCTKAEAAAFVDEMTVLSQLRPAFRGAMHVDAATASWITGMYKGDRAALHKHWGVLIEPRHGELPGHPTPDWATLHADWELLMPESAARGFGFARAGQWLRLLPGVGQGNK